MTTGRLTLGRNIGESVQIGDHLRVTLVHVGATQCTLRITGPGVVRSYNLESNDELRFNPEISLWVNHPGGAGKRARITIQAPKDVVIMRTELIDGPSRSPRPVSRTGSPATSQ